MLKKLFAAAFLIGVLVCSAWAAVPQTIGYQGYLRNGDGTPVNTPVSATFSLYSSNPSRNNPVWRETQGVTSANGIYGVQLGTVAPITAPFDVPYWLGVQVGSDPEMTPLQPLASAPYALHAASASTVTGVLPAATLPVGTGAGTVAAGNDPRLSDARAPLPGSPNYIQNNSGAAQTANISITGPVAAASFSGDGSGLTNVTATSIPQATSDPVAASASNAGHLYFNTTASEARISDGTSWKPVRTGSRVFGRFIPWPFITVNANGYQTNVNLLTPLSLNVSFASGLLVGGSGMGGLYTGVYRIDASLDFINATAGDIIYVYLAQDVTYVNSSAQNVAGALLAYSQTVPSGSSEVVIKINDLFSVNDVSGLGAPFSSIADGQHTLQIYVSSGKGANIGGTTNPTKSYINISMM